VKNGLANLAQINDYDDLIDARSPAEYALDHLPGAISLPVLSDTERALVGTLYKQVSAFEAKKRGAALVARNIATHLEGFFADKPASYRPLVYCWRGGNRSGSLALILQRVGFAAAQLEGGYKAWRRQVVAELPEYAQVMHYRVISGPTGSGKSRLLGALRTAGAQVLDLEGLARHRGSLLGALPGVEQPSQKFFEGRLLAALKGFDPGRVVYAEAESQRIGRLRVPRALLDALHASPVIVLDTPAAARIHLLIEDYADFLAHPERLRAPLIALSALRGRQTVDGWLARLDAGDWPGLVSALLEQHYDPAYRKSLGQHYAHTLQHYPLADVSVSGLATLAATLLADTPAVLPARRAG
jgi:tRNA 2-selenouridine synthase